MLCDDLLLSFLVSNSVNSSLRPKPLQERT